MKRIILITLLAILLAITVFAETHSDYIEEPAPRPPVELIEVPHGVKEENVPYLVMVHDAFDGDIMVDIANAESSFNPAAKNPRSSAKGLFQIVDSTWSSTKCNGDVLNATDNIECAKKIRADAGTTPWNASKNNW